MMKSFWKTIIGVSSILLMMTACSTVSKQESGGKTSPSSNETVKIKVSDNWDGLDELDQALFKQLSAIFARFRENPKAVWNGQYHPESDMFLFVRNSSSNQVAYAYLINFPTPQDLEDARLMSLPQDLKLGDVYRLDTIPNKDRLKVSPYFDFFYPVGNEQVGMFRYTSLEDDYFMSPQEPEQWPLLVIHETFHRYQMIEWMPLLGIQDMENYPYEEESIALVLLELKTLQAALKAVSEEQRDLAVRQFLAIRRYRTEKWDIVANMDSPQELMEGTARYIEHQYKAITSNEDISAGIIRDLKDAELMDDMVKPVIAQGRYYSTGAALSYLVESIGLDLITKSAAGISQVELLMEHFDIEDAAALIIQAKEQHEFETLLQKSVIYAESAKNDTTSSFGMSDDDSPMEEIYIPLKPYGKTPEDLVLAVLPEGYELLGSYSVEASELHPALAAFYNPFNTDIIVTRLKNKSGEEVEIIKVGHEEFSIKDYINVNGLRMISSVEEINDIQVIISIFPAQGDIPAFVGLTFLRGSDLIFINGSISRDEAIAIMMDLSRKQF